MNTHFRKHYYYLALLTALVLALLGVYLHHMQTQKQLSFSESLEPALTQFAGNIAAECPSLTKFGNQKWYPRKIYEFKKWTCFQLGQYL